VEERNIGLGEFRRAEEAFLTGTTIEVLPVVRIDDAPVGNGQPGLLTKRLHSLFQEEITS
jgi:Branched-chain amino acid aminotransferase/4-amino-4-deoxychorismate lyase